MSQDSNAGSPAKPSSGAVSKRPSLKELAAKASQAGAASSVRSSTATPLPTASPSKPDKASIPPEAVARSSSPSTPGATPSKPPEASSEDSGVVNLNVINQSATPEQIAAAEAAKPAVHDLVDDAEGDNKDKPAASDGKDKPTADDGKDKPTAKKDDAGKVKSLAEARAKKGAKKSAAKKETPKVEGDDKGVAQVAAVKKAEEKKGSGATWGIVVAMIGLAAAGIILFRGKQEPQKPVAAVVQEKEPNERPATDTQKIVQAPEPKSTGLSVDSLPTPEPEDSAKAPKVAAAPAATEEELPVAALPTATAPAALATASASDKPGDLSSEMAKAVGGSTDKSVNADDAVPAAGGPSRSQTIPEQPSQGSVASAVGSVMSGAKACVAGADDVSRATLTFSSSGSVKSVSVSGWAASNGKSGCVQSALKGANVGPFSKPSFTVGVTIRP